MFWAADVCSGAALAQSGPVSSISLGRFFSVRVSETDPPTRHLASLGPPHLLHSYRLTTSDSESAVVPELMYAIFVIDAAAHLHRHIR